MKSLIFLLFTLCPLLSYGYQPIPSGMVITFAGTTCPTGYLSAIGTSYLRTAYPQLFAAIGTVNGAADITHFNIPDYRGRALRMADLAAGRDSFTRTAMATGGATSGVGSVQLDATAKNGLTASSTDAGHTHSTYAAAANLGSGATGGLTTGGATGTGFANITTTIGAGDSETVMKNASVLFCIKI
jgi:microcystin-dependent protein